MPDVPPGSSSSDATDPAAAKGNGGSTPKARVNADRASGPKRPPRPAAKAKASEKPSTSEKSATSSRPAAKGRSAARRTGASTQAPTAVAAPAAAAATAVAERPPTVAAPPAVAVDDTGTLPVAPSTAPAPKTRAPRPPGVRRGRRVKRVVRRIDLWSVLKLSLVVYFCLYAAVMATLAAVWSLLHSTNTIDKFTDFLADVGMENFHFYGDQMFRACAAIGALGVIAGTVITVLATALVNIISELTGGIRLVVIEEDPAN